SLERVMSDFQIHPLDLCFRHWPESIASYLVIGPEGPVLVETGPCSTLPTLQGGLAQHGFCPADVKEVLVTHIHLDHGGAAGWWAQQGARVHVHQVGAPHLIDPSKLLSSARRIYGDRMDELWGEVLPAPAQRVHALRDGEPIQAGGLSFVALDTPGHARHHMVYLLRDVAFTGDAAGIRLPNHSYIQVPTVPPEFDLVDWQESIARMRARRLGRLYLTHFGPVNEVEAHLLRLARLLRECAEGVRREMIRGASREEIVGRWADWEAACQPEETAIAKAQLSQSGFGSLGTYVDGIMRYWSKRL
ncbi:MAG: MBL fold metallo-hydrolase, partial [candidate division NC10 bacterium]|nr:MBL fold metallo-hydrolase [candidate division NC10 bacterium]